MYIEYRFSFHLLNCERELTSAYLYITVFRIVTPVIFIKIFIITFNDPQSKCFQLGAYSLLYIR